MSLDLSQSVRTVGSVIKGTSLLIWRHILIFSFVFGISLMAIMTAFAYTDQQLAEVESSKDRQLRQLRESEVSQIRIALGRRLPKNRKADLYFRLAEIYFELYQAEFLREGRAHERLVAAGKKGKINRKRSRVFLRKGLKSSRDLLSLRLKYEKLDRVYYFLAFNNGELGNSQEASRYYRLLIRKFPKSPFVHEANRELGEQAFKVGSYKLASRYFSKARKDEKLQGDPVLLHKLAWSYYRQKKFDQAISTMKEAISRSDKAAGGGASIRDEALKDMALFMTEQNKVAEALDYFKSASDDPKYYPKALAQLANEYQRRGQGARANKVWQALFDSSKDYEDRLRALEKLVENDLKRGRVNTVLKRLEGFDFSVPSDSEFKTIYNNLKARVRTVATQRHRQYRKRPRTKRGRADLKVADVYYSLYLKKFLDSSDTKEERAEIQMYLAEIKVERRDFETALKIYAEVIDSGPEKFRDEAALLRVATLADLLGKKKKKKNEKISDREKEFIAASDTLAKVLPNRPQSHEASLRSAQILAGYPDQEAEAMERARKLTKRAPGTAQGLTAAYLWTQMLWDKLPDVAKADPSDYRKQVEVIEKAFAEIEALPKLAERDKKKNKRRFWKLMEARKGQMRIGRIAAYEKDEDYGRAAKAYESLAGTSKSRKIAEQAYANAVESYVKAGKTDEIRRIAQDWYERYPKSRKAVASVRKGATVLLIQGQFRESAKLFDELGSEGWDAAALETAAILYAGIGKKELAKHVRVKYLDKYTKEKNRWKVALELGQFHEQEKDYVVAGEKYRICFDKKSPVRAECGVRLGLLYRAERNFDDAKRVFRQVASIRKVGKKSLSPFVGYADYLLAEFLETSKDFAPLSLPQKKLEKSLASRLKFFETLSQAYQKAVGKGGPWAIASLYRLGKWTQDLANEIDGIAPPPNADKATVARFQKTLKDVSRPLRKKALNTFARAYRTASRSRILSPSIISITGEMALREVKWPRLAQGIRTGYRFAGDESSMEDVRAALMKNPKDSKAWNQYGNLLRADDKPILATMAYDRAIALKPRNPEALNNRGVMYLWKGGADDWFHAGLGQSLLQRSIRRGSFLLPPKHNLGLLFTYYRLFRRARTLWDQVLPKAKDLPEARVGHAACLHADGRFEDAQVEFKKAQKEGAEISEFAGPFHEALWVQSLGVKGNEKCRDTLDRIDRSDLKGFEVESFEQAKKLCARSDEEDL